MRSADSTYSPVNKIEQPIDRIDSDTPTLDKQQTHVFPYFYKYISPSPILTGLGTKHLEFF